MPFYTANISVSSFLWLRSIHNLRASFKRSTPGVYRILPLKKKKKVSDLSGIKFLQRWFHNISARLFEMKPEKICGFDHSVSSLSVRKSSIKIYRAGGKSRDWCFLSPAWCRRGLFLSGCRGQACLLGTLVALCRREGGKRKSGAQPHTRARTHRHISSTLKRNSMPAPVDICFHRCAHPMWLRLALHTHRAMLRWCANTVGAGALVWDARNSCVV